MLWKPKKNFLHRCFVTLQGTVLSVFFWGYCMTQLIGGHLSDRRGGDKIMTFAAAGWAVLTLLTPCLPLMYGTGSILFVMAFVRMLVGICQGELLLFFNIISGQFIKQMFF
jgi:MFS family permease